MSDDVARAVGAGGGMTVKIAGKECTVRPLGLRELKEVERDCLERYRRAYLESFSKNVDLLPENKRMGFLEGKMEEAARWDVDDLPIKFAYDSDSIVLTKALRDYIAEYMGFSKEERSTFDERKWRRIVTSMLDQETLTEKQYVELTGKPARKLKVSYVNWWVTGSFEGMVSFTWYCFKANGVTRDQVEEEVSKNPSLLMDTSREIERLSSPNLGNG